MHEITERQQREIAYHALHSEVLRQNDQPVSYEVLKGDRRKWWNHYWFAVKATRGALAEQVLVPGCGDGFDAIVMANLFGSTATVTAFDLSAEMLSLARDRASQADVTIQFDCMAAEYTDYADGSFDLIFVRDLLHHCDVGRTMKELIRVAKPGATIVIDELYTHRFLQRMREARLGRWLYPKVSPHIYKHRDPYITEDERKLNENDVSVMRNALETTTCTYFNAVVNRFTPDWDAAEIADRALLTALWPLRGLIAGRVIVKGRIALAARGATEFPANVTKSVDNRPS